MRYRVFLDEEEIPVYSARTSKIPFNRVWEGSQRPLEQTDISYFVTFDVRKPLKLRIDVSEDALRNVEIRPYEFGLSHTESISENGGTITIQIDRPRLFTVEINGLQSTLAVFANPPYVYESRKGDIVFKKGVHHAGLIVPESGERVILEEGAVVYGAIYIKDSENVTVEGRGILDCSPYRRGNDMHRTEENSVVQKALKNRGLSDVDCYYSGIVTVYNSKNVVLDGIILRDSPMWTLIVRNGCRNVCMNNIKIIGQWRYNSDGVDICNSRACILQDSFVRSFDDCVVVRAPYLDGEEGECSDIVVRNNVLWCDWGKNLEIWSGHKDSHIHSVVFSDNYLIHVCMTAVSVDTWYGSESIRTENVVYENLSVYADENAYAPQYQGSDTQSFDYDLRLPYDERTLIYIAVGKIGRKLPNQACDANVDVSGYHISYRNIAFHNITEYGGHAKIRVLPDHVKLSDIVLDDKSLLGEQQDEN